MAPQVIVVIVVLGVVELVQVEIAETDHLVTELTSAGVSITPPIGEITATSDTGEASRRHVLAICYALVQKVDEEPVVAVRLRMPRVTAPHSGGSASDDMLALADIDPRTFYATIIL